jgi:hypothetical protein
MDIMTLKFELVWTVKIRKQRFGSDEDWYHEYPTASTRVAQGAPPRAQPIFQKTLDGLSMLPKT